MNVAVPAGLPPRKVRVVVVDDSTTMLRLIKAAMEQDGRIEVVGIAGSAQAARGVIKDQEPDVVTLDLDMPQVNGIEFLGHIMRLRPMPVVIFSGLADDPATATKALSLGAFAVVSKTGDATTSSLTTLCNKVVAAGDLAPSDATPTAPATDKLILIGSSTGGLPAIEEVLSQLSPSGPPIVIAQHMPQRFLESFSERLDRTTGFRVMMAAQGAQLVPGGVYVAPAQELQTEVIWRRSAWFIGTTPRVPEDQYCPSVDRLFHSAVKWSDKVGALILTGLGNDGAQGLKALRDGGARTIGQSEDSCVVYGMPHAARDLGAVEKEVHVNMAGTTLLRLMEAHT